MNGDDHKAGRASTIADVAGSDPGRPLPRSARAMSPHAAISVAADEIALNALQVRRETAARAACDICERPIEGEPAGSGLYFWTRDGEARWEEPALCARCAPAIGMSAHKRFTSEDEGGE